MTLNDFVAYSSPLHDRFLTVHRYLSIIPATGSRVDFIIRWNISATENTVIEGEGRKGQRPTKSSKGSFNSGLTIVI